jgi:hypothetical protein
MPITKSLVFDKVSINLVDYTPHLADSAEVTVEPVEQMVKNGQALVSAWDVSFSVDLLDDNVVNAASLVYTNTANSPTRTNIVFGGTTGAATLTIADVIINATPNFEGERVAYTLTGSKRVTTLPSTVTVA